MTFSRGQIGIGRRVVRGGAGGGAGGGVKALLERFNSLDDFVLGGRRGPGCGGGVVFLDNGIEVHSLSSTTEYYYFLFCGSLWRPCVVTRLLQSGSLGAKQETPPSYLVSFMKRPSGFGLQA